MNDYTNTGHAIAVLTESAKQHRLAGDDGHARACDRAAELLGAGDGEPCGESWAFEFGGRRRPSADRRLD